MAEEIIERIEGFGLSKKDRPKAQFSKVGIVGCGNVGRTIALMISKAGIEVVFIELSQAKIDEARGAIDKELARMIGRWGMTESEKKGIMTRIVGSEDWKDLKGCDLVIEVIRSKGREERIEVRKEIFRKIEENVDPHTIIATNSTTLVITELAAELEHKDRCVSMFFSTGNPEAKIIEVVKGLYTSQEVCDNVNKFTKLIGRIPVPVEESPGLISVRVFVALMNEACEALMEGVSTKENIDLAMRDGFSIPLGPFELADKIGLDKVVRWMDNLYNEFGDMKYKPSPVIKRLVRANRLGRINGHGFYKYDKEGKKIED